MKGLNRIQWCSIILLVGSLVACQVKRPDTVLTDAKMESVLLDYHIAKAMGEEVSYSEAYKRVLYLESVYKKHGITQAQFDSSMVWFVRYPDILAKIYDKVNTRLRGDRDNINNLIAQRNNTPKESLPGDSIDVWAWQQVYQLTGMPLDNKITFTLLSDSNFKDRDTLRWSARFRLHKEVGVNVPLMAMKIYYDNDSVVSGLLKVDKSGMNTLSIAADTLGAIKRISGFIYYPPQESARHLLVDRISLMRYHATDSIPAAATDSLAIAGNANKDSLQQTLPDTLKKLDLKEEKMIDRRREPRPRPAKETSINKPGRTLKIQQRL